MIERHHAIVDKSKWPLAERLTFLNHGSFGATPREILERQRRFQDEVESNPIEGIGYTYFERLDDAIDHAARFLRAPKECVALVPNATYGINSVLRSLDFQPGDELVVANHRYPSVGNTLQYLADRLDVKLRVVKLSMPVVSVESLIEDHINLLGPRTKLLVVDHIASGSALRMPIEAIVKAAKNAGVPVLVDGAHAPGQVHIDLESLGADFYAANFHKWLFVPRSLGFLYVAEEWRDRIHPATISNYYGKGYSHEFAWTGTLDPTPVFCLKSGIDFFNRLGAGMLMARNHELAMYGAKRVCAALVTKPSAPLTQEFYGSMFSCKLPHLSAPDPAKAAIELRQTFLKDHQIEVHFSAIERDVWLRLSAQAYNGSEDMDRLAIAVAALLSPK